MFFFAGLHLLPQYNLLSFGFGKIYDVIQSLINVSLFGECLIVDDMVSIFSVVQWIFGHGLAAVEMYGRYYVGQILDFGRFGQLPVVFLLFGAQIVRLMLLVAFVPLYLRVGAHIRQHGFFRRQRLRTRNKFQCETCLQVIGECGRHIKWDPNEGHRWMFDVEDLLVKRLHEIVVDADAAADAQEWISEIVASAIEDNREGLVCAVDEFGTSFCEPCHILTQRDIRWCQ